MTKKDKVLVILGSEGRLGKSLCNFFNKKKYKVIGLDIKKTKNKSNYIRIKTDISNENNLNDIIKKISFKFKKIDNVINCIYPQANSWGKDFKKITKKELDNHFSLHLSDLIIVLRSFLKQFEKQGFGSFVFLSSIQGLTAPKFEHYKGTKMNSCLEYSIIKAGIINMTKYLAKLYKRKNMRFNCISLGGIEENQPKKFKINYKKSCLGKGLLSPEDIHSAVEFIISEKSSSLNGQNIIVDDGWSL